MRKGSPSSLELLLNVLSHLEWFDSLILLEKRSGIPCALRGRGYPQKCSICLWILFFQLPMCLFTIVGEKRKWSREIQWKWVLNNKCSVWKCRIQAEKKLNSLQWSVKMPHIHVMWYRSISRNRLQFGANILTSLPLKKARSSIGAPMISGLTRPFVILAPPPPHWLVKMSRC